MLRRVFVIPSVTPTILRRLRRKKMATGTFTYNALRAITLKERIKTQGKIVSRSTSTRAMMLV